MLADERTIDAVVEGLELVGEAPVVVDPVMISESGATLLDPTAKAALIERVLPRATVITPNLPEARALSGLGERRTARRARRGAARARAGRGDRHRRPRRRRRRRARRPLRHAADRRAALPGRAPRTAPAAPTPRRWRRCSPAGSSSRRRRAGRARSRPRRSATACASSAPAPARSTSSGSPAWTRGSSRGIIGLMKLVRMKSGHGDVLLAEGDPEVAEDEERLIAEFRRQLDLGMWAAVPTADRGRRRGDDGARLRRGPARRRAGDLLPAGGGRLSDGRGRASARASSCARSSSDRDYEAYEQLGFVSVTGPQPRATRTSSTRTGRWSPTTPRPGELLTEYCVGFDDDGRAAAARRRRARQVDERCAGGERDLIAEANLNRARPPGRPRPRCGATSPGCGR